MKRDVATAHFSSYAEAATECTEHTQQSTNQNKNAKHASLLTNRISLTWNC